MENMFITPITLMQGVSGITGIGDNTNTQKVTGADGTSLFRGIFEDMINDVRDAEDDLMKKQYLLATGQIDDPHTVPIAAAELQLSVDMLVQLRNKALEAYQSLISISM